MCGSTETRIRACRLGRDLTGAQPGLNDLLDLRLRFGHGRLDGAAGGTCVATPIEAQREQGGIQRLSRPDAQAGDLLLA